LMSSTATRFGPAKKFMEKFSNGKPKLIWMGDFADDGRFLLHGTTKWFYENGEPHYKASFELGRKVGAETLWRGDGTIAWQWQHEPDGTGMWTQFWENGKKKSESLWKNFTADGKAQTWDRDGKLLSDVEFVKG